MRVYRLEGLDLREVAAALHQHLGPDATVGANAVRRGFWYTEAPRQRWEQLSQGAHQVEIPLPGGRTFSVTCSNSDGTPVQRRTPRARTPTPVPQSSAKRPRRGEPAAHSAPPAVILPPPLQDIQYQALPYFPWKDFLRSASAPESRLHSHLARPPPLWRTIFFFPSSLRLPPPALYASGP